VRSLGLKLLVTSAAVASRVFTRFARNAIVPLRWSLLTLSPTFKMKKPGQLSGRAMMFGSSNFGRVPARCADRMPQRGIPLP